MNVKMYKKGTDEEQNIYCFDTNTHIDAMMEVIILKALITQVEMTPEEGRFMQNQLHEALTRARNYENPN